MRRCKHCMSSFKIEIARFFVRGVVREGGRFCKGSRTRGSGGFRIRKLQHSPQVSFLVKNVLRGMGDNFSALKEGP